MTHDELLEELESMSLAGFIAQKLAYALRAVVELHKPDGQSKPFPDWANCCGEAYPCSTIQVIDKELNG